MQSLAPLSIFLSVLDVFDRVGGFSEAGKGTPEDLIFFFRHLQLGGKVFRHPDDLLVYRYHQTATTFSIDEYETVNLYGEGVNNSTVIISFYLILSV